MHVCACVVASIPPMYPLPRMEGGLPAGMKGDMAGVEALQAKVMALSQDVQCNTLLGGGVAGLEKVLEVGPGPLSAGRGRAADVYPCRPGVVGVGGDSSVFYFFHFIFANCPFFVFPSAIFDF